MRKSVISSMIALFIAGCGGSGGGLSGPSRDSVPNNIAQCSQPDKNLVWFDFLEKNYLWDQQLPNSIDAFAYATSQAMLDDVKAPEDRFSFVLPSSTWDDISSGNAFGYGMRLDFNESDDYIRIVYTYENAGAGRAGLERGDRILSLGDTPASDIIDWARTNDSRYDELLGPDQAGFELAASWQKPNGEIVNSTLVKGNIQVNTVMGVSTLNSNAGTVGYLSFQEGFLDPSAGELDQAFDFLYDSAVKELVLDLRYNGGGRVDVSQRLATHIAGDKVRDNLFLTFLYNSNISSDNYFFNNAIDSLKPDDAQPYNDIFNKALNLDRLVVLTSAESCSASEIVVNALRPYMEVTTVGSTTCGKPVGMVPDEYCDETMLAINFQAVNAVGFGDYFNGITADCPVSDETVVANWGDRNDPAIDTAISYLENGSCANAASMGYKPEPATAKPLYLPQ
ncbi:hypothetical protein HR060_08345 [Catenovulum sp. SM1970]|uniref:S41 family peptidase n=1 Tax=Marinifaba aquimaris TaxID=2741323 RepID=UPI001574C383|nr:S41 family peptidase [Marinifaba aquimaris]NTS76879.1 hypothetical protein [Marinifaba aquimaris]